MFRIKCPKCGFLIGGFLADYVSWRSDQRKCPKCGTGLKLEFLSRLLCYLILVPIFAAVLIFLMSTAGDLWWLNLFIAFVVLWGLNPVLVRVLGRWKTFQLIEMGTGAWFWTVVMWGSLAAMAVSMCVVVISVGRVYIEFIRQAGSLESGLGTGEGEGIFSVVPAEALVSFGVAIAALLVNFFARVMRRTALLKGKQQSLESELSDLVK
ncbi:MAG: zinc ribbon domain-containing protein [Planctomycetota bacterium]